MTSLFTQFTHAHTHAQTRTHTHPHALTHVISQSQQPPNHLGLPNLQPLIIVWHFGRGKRGHPVAWASGPQKKSEPPTSTSYGLLFQNAQAQLQFLRLKRRTELFDFQICTVHFLECQDNGLGNVLCVFRRCHRYQLPPGE